ncbi:hemerythrin domain-containing protein [Parendozoicomonas sp. Alg238-R29]|uniref:hemerythrin domain-containing protein n=1 Tax=Parendozoicomonas sp. Alg238-R29 TaxID=2993446 RepID=UPI00248DC2F9|nr:hemerythrin domain-containing protein [Parendozoicomonas sp. Alg238-R29]
MNCVNQCYFDQAKIRPVGQISVYPGFSSYDERLTKVLNHEHREILATYIELSLGCKKGNANNGQLLVRFTNQLKNHFILEDSKLYPNLFKGLKEYPSSKAIIENVSMRMHNASQKIAQFLQETKSTEMCDRDWSHFEIKLSAIGKSLKERVDLEEQVLFPIYDDLHHF